MKIKTFNIALIILLALSMTAAGCKKSGGGNGGLLALLGLGGGASAPQVGTPMPADGATGVSVTPTITIPFSGDMDGSTVTSGNITLTGGTLGPITLLVNYDALLRTATITVVSPNPLEYLTQYTVSVSDDVRDLKGRYLAGDVSWTFTTVAEGTVPAPTFLPLPGTHDAAVDVAISCTDGAATIRYTTDGTTEPSRTVGTEYTGTPVHIADNRLLRAIAYRTGWEASTVTDGQYNIRTAAPTFNIDGDTYDANQSVELSAPGAIIYYTMTTGTVASPPDDPADPTILSDQFGTAIPVNGHNTIVKIKAMAFIAGMSLSNIVSETYTIVYGQVAAPTFDPPEETYTGTQNITIASTTAGATIRYTTDGVTEPSRTVGTEHSSPVVVEVSQNTVLKAMAYKDGMVDSTVTTGTFNIRVAKPTFSPAAGTHADDIDIEINSSGDHVYYETTSATGSTPADPDDPTVSSDGYSTAIPAHGHNTIVKIKAIATKAGMTQSEIEYGEFIIDWSLNQARWNQAIWGVHKWNP